MIKKQNVLNMVNDWLKEMETNSTAFHYMQRLEKTYGVDMYATLATMNYAQLSLLLCAMVGQNAKAHNDARKWREDHKQSQARYAAEDKAKAIAAIQSDKTLDALQKHNAIRSLNGQLIGE